MGCCAWSMQWCGEWNGAFAQALPSCSAFTLGVVTETSVPAEPLEGWELSQGKCCSLCDTNSTQRSQVKCYKVSSPCKPTNPVSCTVLRQCFFGRKIQHVSLPPHSCDMAFLAIFHWILSFCAWQKAKAEIPGSSGYLAHSVMLALQNSPPCFPHMWIISKVLNWKDNNSCPTFFFQITLPFSFSYLL